MGAALRHSRYDAQPAHRPIHGPDPAAIAPLSSTDPEYEALQLELLYRLYEKGTVDLPRPGAPLDRQLTHHMRKGLIYRGKKPVYWSPSSRSALAEAELEYPESYASTAAYLRFPIDSAGPRLASILRGAHVDTANLSAAIWTTTPWTIPANLVRLSDAPSLTVPASTTEQ